MIRGELRSYIRFLANELTEAPEGLFTDTELNLLINISQKNVALELGPFIPWAIEKTFLISTIANKREYEIETDLCVSDFFMMDGIFHNEEGYEQTELRWVERDQLVEYRVLGKTGEPSVWSWHSQGVIALDPTPDQTVANKYLAVYIPIFKDLNQDTEHDPLQNKYAIPFNGLSILYPCHELVALDVLKRWAIRSKEGIGSILSLYHEVFTKVLSQMQQAQGVNWKGRPPVADMIKTSGSKMYTTGSVKLPY